MRKTSICIEQPVSLNNTTNYKFAFLPTHTAIKHFIFKADLLRVKGGRDETLCTSLHRFEDSKNACLCLNIVQVRSTSK